MGGKSSQAILIVKHAEMALRHHLGRPCDRVMVDVNKALHTKINLLIVISYRYLWKN